jgi:hypothetical protein
MIGGDLCAISQRDTFDLTCLDVEIDHPALEANLAAKLSNRFAHVLNHRHQFEGADMRLADIENFRRRTGLDEFLQHFAAVVLRILDLAVQLAIGKSAGAAFAELHIRFRIQLALAP